MIGVDVLLSVSSPSKTTGKRTLNMHLLELNQNPSFLCFRSELDLRVKMGIISQCLELMNIVQPPDGSVPGAAPFSFSRLMPAEEHVDKLNFFKFKV